MFLSYLSEVFNNLIIGALRMFFPNATIVSELEQDNSYDEDACEINITPVNKDFLGALPEYMPYDTILDQLETVEKDTRCIIEWDNEHVLADGPSTVLLNIVHHVGDAIIPVWGQREILEWVTYLVDNSTDTDAIYMTYRARSLLTQIDLALSIAIHAARVVEDRNKRAVMFDLRYTLEVVDMLKDYQAFFDSVMVLLQ